MTFSAVLRRDPDGTLRPRQRAATFPELTVALRQYLLIVTGMHRRGRGAAGLRYGSSEELVLFNCAPVWADLGAMQLPPMPPKECFDNARKVAADRPEYRYTEGFALMDGSIPTHHAWLTGPGGEAVDPTWPAVYQRHAERQPAKRWSGRVVYMGIVVSHDVHARWIERTGYPNLLAVYEADVLELLRHGPGCLQ